MASPTPSDDESPSSGIPSKRKGSHLGNGSNEKKKRSRVSFSCSECHRRKQKCDRQQPCGHCIARRVPELCHAYQPGKTEGDLHVRLSRVERVLELALPQYMNGGGGSPGRPENKPTPSSLSLPPYRAQSTESIHEDELREDELPGAVGTLQDHSGPFYGTEALGSVNSTPILEQFHATQLPSVDEAAAAADKLRHLVQDCGLQPHKLEELVRSLPPKSYCDDLINFFFKSINYTRYPIFEPQFRAPYEALLAKEHRVHPIDLRFLPLLFIVLATAARLAPDHLAGDDTQRKVTSLRYYWSARNALMIAAAVGESLELVLARLLISRYLIADRRITEAWNTLGTAVRTALALGLHRDGAKLGLDPFQTEYRRRIWAYLYHADRSNALVLGRPPSVQDEYCDTLPPTNSNDNFLMGPQVKIPRGQPLSQPTPMTFAILRIGLARIIGRIVRHFQQVKPTHYSDVIVLDEELIAFTQSLPPHYALEPDTSLDSTLPFIAPHRFLIVSEIFFVRISLHRPYMLRKLDSDRFAYSRKACFESAQRDWEVRQSFKRGTHPDVIRCLGGAYREFQSAMISGISLALDPHGPDAIAMHKILDSFLSDHVGTNATDETTRRELKIIELLKSKSLSVAAGEPLHSPPSARKRELTDDDADGKSRISALRTVPVPVPRPGRPRAGSFSGVGNTLTSPGYHGSETMGDSSAQSSPAWGTGPPGTPIRAHAGPRNIHRNNSLDEDANGLQTLSPLESSSSSSAAQRLLDNWVNNAQIDSVGSGQFGLNGLDSINLMNGSIGTAGGWLGLDGAAAGSSAAVAGNGAGPSGQHPALPRTDSADLLGAASSGLGDPTAVDWNYWENLIEQIRAAGGSA